MRLQSEPTSPKIFIAESGASPLMHVRSTPARLASCRRMSYTARALLQSRGRLPLADLHTGGRAPGQQLAEHGVAPVQPPGEAIVHRQRLPGHEPMLLAPQRA